MDYQKKISIAQPSSQTQIFDDFVMKARIIKGYRRCQPSQTLMKTKPKSETTRQVTKFHTTRQSMDHYLNGKIALMPNRLSPIQNKCSITLEQIKMPPFVVARKLKTSLDRASKLDKPNILKKSITEKSDSDHFVITNYFLARQLKSSRIKHNKLQL